MWSSATKWILCSLALITILFFGALALIYFSDKPFKCIELVVVEADYSAGSMGTPLPASHCDREDFKLLSFFRIDFEALGPSHFRQIVETYEPQDSYFFAGCTNFLTLFRHVSDHNTPLHGKKLVLDFSEEDYYSIYSGEWDKAFSIKEGSLKSISIMSAEHLGPGKVGQIARALFNNFPTIDQIVGFEVPATRGPSQKRPLSRELYRSLLAQGAFARD